MAGRKALVITAEMTYVDGVAVPTPRDYAEQGFGAMLHRVSRTFDGAGVVILHPSACVPFGLPCTPAELAAAPDTLDSHPALEDARAAGWRAGKLWQWTSFYADTHPGAVNVGLMGTISTADFPLGAPNCADTAYNLARWHERTGVAWSGTASTAGLEVMVQTWPGRQPSWTDTGGPPECEEADYHITDWRARRAGTRWAHSYDANRAYISSCNGVPISPWKLKRTGSRVDFDPKNPRGGWWLVEIAPWTIPHMPDPAGYDPTGKKRRVRWVTTPTMVLLAELAQAGVHGGWILKDSWTGPAGAHLRPYATAMRKAWDACTDPRCLDGKATFNDDLLCMVCVAVKEAGRKAIGLIDSPTNWAYRHDWRHSNIAQFRSNMWRRAWKVGGGEGGKGPWPLWIDVDNIWYGSDLDDPRAACPPGIVIGTKLGEFKPKHSRQNRRIAA